MVRTWRGAKASNTIAMNSIFGHIVLFYNLRLPNRGYKTFNNVLTAAEKKVFVPASHREFYRRAIFCFRVYCLIINTKEASKSSLKASSVYNVVSEVQCKEERISADEKERAALHNREFSLFYFEFNPAGRGASKRQ